MMSGCRLWIILVVLVLHSVLEQGHCNAVTSFSTPYKSAVGTGHIAQAHMKTKSEADISADSSAIAGDGHHKMSFTALCINMIADLTPHGMLPLAFGLSQGGPTGLVPALGLVLLFGISSLYTMTMYAKIAESTKSKSISDIWAKLINPKSRWIVDTAILTLCAGCCLFYSSFIGDIFGAIVTALGIGGDSWVSKRWFVLVSISTFVLLPLCLLEDLSALGASSILGVTGILYTVGFHLWRLFDGSYEPNSPLLATIAEKLRPSFPADGPKFNLWNVNSGTLVLANMLCVGFLSHYNSINYYNELQDVTQEKYNRAVTTSYSVSGTFFVIMMLAGYSLFGFAAQPLILNNFPRKADAFATVARLATGCAITFAYPLMFAAVKNSAKSLKSSLADARSSVDTTSLDASAPISKTQFTLITVGLLGLITAVAVQCGEEDVSVVLGLLGSVIGCTVAYLLPGVLGLVDMRRRKKMGLKNSLSDVIACHALVPMGVIFGVLGVWITLKDLHNGHGHGH